MQRVNAALVGVLVAALMFTAVAPAALAEGHSCREWYPDPYYGGYWIWLTCPSTEPGHWGPWFAELPTDEWNNPYLEIHEPYYY